jgi:hypothetical protein
MLCVVPCAVFMFCRLLSRWLLYTGIKGGLVMYYIKNVDNINIVLSKFVSRYS